jgi:cyclohexa-1,5-dienecarbonyl-CoA hydratase
VVEDESFDSAVESIVGQIAAGSPLIIRLNKRAVTVNQGKDFPSALKGVTDLFLNTLMKTEDTLEGIASFYEKRKPVWKNR